MFYRAHSYAIKNAVPCILRSTIHMPLTSMFPVCSGAHLYSLNTIPLTSVFPVLKVLASTNYSGSPAHYIGRSVGVWVSPGMYLDGSGCLIMSYKYSYTSLYVKPVLITGYHIFTSSCYIHLRLTNRDGFMGPIKHRVRGTRVGHNIFSK